jgi:hypothetical protein
MDCPWGPRDAIRPRAGKAVAMPPLPVASERGSRGPIHNHDKGLHLAGAGGRRPERLGVPADTWKLQRVGEAMASGALGGRRGLDD